jgi:hypothetical protein
MISKVIGSIKYRAIQILQQCWFWLEINVMGKDKYKKGKFNSF